MPEREPRLGLLAETRRLLKQGEELGGEQIALVPDRSLDELAQARLIISRSPGQPHELRYNPEDRQARDHLIAHEVGHLVRLHAAPPEERYLAAINGEARRLAGRKLLPYLEELARLGLPDRAIRQVFDIWHQGIVLQLANAPADLRIEQWLHQEHPALRESQKHSLGNILDRYALMQADPRFIQTPHVIRGANVELNAAVALQYARLFRDQLFADQYPLYITKRAELMLREGLDAPDLGHEGDRQLTDQWAQRYALKGWYRWVPLAEAGQLRRMLDRPDTQRAQRPPEGGEHP